MKLPKYLIIIVLLIYSCNGEKDKIMTFYNIEQAIKAPKETKGLRITKDDLKTFEEHLNLFSNLEFLVIANKKWVVVNYDGKIDPNTIEKITLPSNISRLKSLRILILDNYYIDALPNDISLLDKLEEMKLSYTSQVNLNAEVNKIRTLKSLREIDLTNSTITPQVIRNAFKELPSVNLTIFHGDIEPQY